MWWFISACPMWITNRPLVSSTFDSRSLPWETWPLIHSGYALVPSCHVLYILKVRFYYTYFLTFVRKSLLMYLQILFVFFSRKYPKAYHLDRKRCIFFDVGIFQGRMLTLPSDSFTFFQRRLKITVISDMKLLKTACKLHAICILEHIR